MIGPEYKVFTPEDPAEPDGLCGRRLQALYFNLYESRFRLCNRYEYS